MTWTLGPVEVRDTVVSQGTAAADCVLCVEDYGGQMTAEQMGVHVSV